MNKHAEMINWKPIETAPLDKRILVIANGRVHIAYWEQDGYAIRPRPYWRIEEFHQTMMCRTAQVTHWMDIPDIEASDEAAPRHGVALEPLVRDICSHIREPMTLDDLVEYIASNDYSAELALQHALILLAR